MKWGEMKTSIYITLSSKDVLGKGKEDKRKEAYIKTGYGKESKMSNTFQLYLYVLISINKNDGNQMEYIMKNRRGQ